MIRSLVYLCFIILIHFVGSSSTFDHDVEDVVSYLVANSERGALLRRRRLDGPYYQDGTGCEGTLLSGRRRELTEYMYKNPEIVQHIQRHRELTQSSFVYDNSNSLEWADNFDNATQTYYPNCQWAPYQVVAWVIPQDPEITGMVDGGVANPALDGVIQSSNAILIFSFCLLHSPIMSLEMV